MLKLNDKDIKPALFTKIKPSEDEQKTIFEILHRRSGKVSTIFCSQYPSSEWYDQLGGTANPLTDSILDRIIHNAYTIDIRGSDPNKDISMREFRENEARLLLEVIHKRRKKSSTIFCSQYEEKNWYN